MMIVNKEKIKSLPDVAKTSRPKNQRQIDTVGMSDIECSVRWYEDLNSYSTHALCDLGVNLTDPEAKGIHMSRLQQLLMAFVSEHFITPDSLGNFLQQVIDSHVDLSTLATCSFSFRHKLKQSSLVSGCQGDRFYPVVIKASKWSHQAACFELQFTLSYSSTCPCSAALSRQAIAEQFLTDFKSQDYIDKSTITQWLESDKGSLATPHSQRSEAMFSLSFGPLDQFPLSQLIIELEDCLQTAVQSVVKREDEQAFAKKNGQNLMFAEDSVRKLADRLDQYKDILDYRVSVTHFESLHPHNAVASIQKK